MASFGCLLGSSLHAGMPIQAWPRARPFLALLNFEWVACELAAPVETRMSSEARCPGEHRLDAALTGRESLEYLYNPHECLLPS